MKKYLFDTHCDTLMEYVKDAKGFRDGEFDVTFAGLSTYDHAIQTFAMYFDAAEEMQERKKMAKAYLEAFADMKKKYPIKQILTPEDILEVDQKGGIGAILSIESACVFDNDDEDLAFYKEQGVKLISLTHFANTQYGCGNLMGDSADVKVGGYGDYHFQRGDGIDVGLTMRGKEMVGKLEESRIILDISHLSFKAIEDVVEIAKRPFLASHSNIYDVFPHNRNLKKEIVMEMIKRKCLIGMCFYPGFVSTKEEVYLEDVLLHMEYLLSLGGENNICLGSDFDGIPTKVRGLEDVAKVHGLAELMLQKNYNEDLVRKIMWGNAKNFFMENM